MGNAEEINCMLDKKRIIIPVIVLLIITMAVGIGLILGSKSVGVIGGPDGSVKVFVNPEDRDTSAEKDSDTPAIDISCLSH